MVRLKLGLSGKPVLSGQMQGWAQVQTVCERVRLRIQISHDINVDQSYSISKLHGRPGKDLLVSLSDLSKTSKNDARVLKRNEGGGQGEILAKQARQSETEPLVIDVLEEGGQGEIPAKQARQSETEPLVVDVIDDFQLSVTVVNVVAYVAGYIIRKIQLQTKCLECLGKLSDTSLVVPESKLLIHF